MKLSAEHQPHAHARADGEEREVVDPLRDTGPVLADRREVHVVLERHVDAQPLAKLAAEGPAFEPGDVRRRQLQRAFLCVDHARNAENDTIDALDRKMRGRNQGLVQAADRLQRPVCVSAAQLDVLTRTHLTGEVADSSAQEPRTEVQAEHVRRVRDRLEEDGPVARPSGGVGGLPDEPRVEQRLEGQRDGRLRDVRAAGDLGP